MGTIAEIVVVSSDSGNCNALESILSRHGCNARFASNVAECAQLVSHHNVDLVLCDRILTGGTYGDVLAVTHSAKRIHVVVTSRLADWNQYVEALHDGAFDLIASPCDVNDVVWMLKRAKCQLKENEPEMHPKARHHSSGGAS
jgi:DNA-binding NtrC family response regulator